MGPGYGRVRLGDDHPVSPAISWIMEFPTSTVSLIWSILMIILMFRPGLMFMFACGQGNRPSCLFLGHLQESLKGYAAITRTKVSSSFVFSRACGSPAGIQIESPLSPPGPRPRPSSSCRKIMYISSTSSSMLLDGVARGGSGIREELCTFQEPARHYHPRGRPGAPVSRQHLRIVEITDYHLTPSPPAVMSFSPLKTIQRVERTVDSKGRAGTSRSRSSTRAP